MTSVYVAVSLKSSQQLEVISRLLCVILVAIAQALLKLYRGGGGGGEGGQWCPPQGRKKQIKSGLNKV